MSEPDSNFKQRVEALVRQIPTGRVMTYGQLAALCGNARAARIVGGIAHFGDSELPWQRVVNKQGGLAAGYPGGRLGHRQVLEQEGFTVTDDYSIDVTSLLWWPTDRSTKNVPLLVLVGETASGKSTLALQLAQHFNGEIICADSSTVRREANIGTAKPTIEERALVPHHLIDVVGPDEPFSAATFKRLAEQAIVDIAARGKLPIMVGGTGLYIDSILYDYSFRASVSTESRQQLDAMTNDQLLSLIKQKGYDLGTVDTNNSRRLVRFIETGGTQPTKQVLRDRTLVLGLKTDKEVLHSRIVQRVDAMFEHGLEQEVAELAETYGWDAEALKSVGYSQWRAQLTGSQNAAETRLQIIKATRDLAKRQATWFKRNKSIHWLTTPVKWDNVVDSVTTFLFE